MRKWHIGMIGMVVAVLLVALVLASCGSSTTTTTAGPATTAGGATTTTAGGAVDAAALFAQYCQGCHNNPPSGSVDAVTAAIESGKGNMPSLKDKLSTAQIAAIATWVANGGK
jgi:mono/diheme cytochrome c family protein